MKKILLFISAAISLNALAQVPTNGLEVDYPFSGNSNDMSGNSYNGINNGATLTSDRFGIANTAYDFSSAGYIDCNNILNGTFAGANKVFSISFWVKPSATNTNNVILAKHADAGCSVHEREFFIRELNDLINVEYYGTITGTQARNICGSTLLTDYTKWYHVVIVYDGAINTNNGLDRVKIFIDMLPETTTLSCRVQPGTFPFDMTSGPAHFGVGNYLNSNATPCLSTTRYNGKIDDIRIYNREITQNEIASLFHENICIQNINVTDTLIINAGISGFNPITYQHSIKIFPNPSNNQITIDYGNYTAMTGYTLKITNSLGQTVFTSLINQQQTVINLSTWSGNGIYFVHLIDSQSNTIDIKKIVLQ